MRIPISSWRSLGVTMLVISAWLFGNLAAIAQTQPPAVSDINAKISAFGGSVGASDTDAGAGGLAASLSIPVAHAFGLQLDGAYARMDDDNFGSAGAHLFWRNPLVGMVGFYAGYARLDALGGIDVGRVGGEAQYYFNQFTLDGAAGLRYGDLPDQGYGRARLQFYPTENLSLQSGWVYEGRSFGNIGLEYQAASQASMGLSVFADANVSNRDNYSILAGLRVAFGKNMSLKDRHRRQDPDAYTNVDLLATLSAAQAKRGQASSVGAPVNYCPLNVWLPSSDTCTCPGGSARTSCFSTFRCGVSMGC